jgi:hypothetical protein
MSLAVDLKKTVDINMLRLAPALVHGANPQEKVGARGGPRRLDRTEESISVFCETDVNETGAEDEKKAQEPFIEFQG